jgi:ribosomal protein S1
MIMSPSLDLQVLEVIVERVLPFGVFVRLPDGTPGYIRRRELDLDADVVPTAVVQAGQKIQAVVIKAGDADTRIELSRRATLKDPWPDFTQRYHTGDVVRGIVRALHRNGAFVRVQAGINGFVPLVEIATWDVKKPEDILWVGDAVEAIIKDLDTNQQRLSLSIKALMIQRDAVKSSIRSSGQSDITFPLPALAKTPSQLSLEARDRIGTILVLDDHDKIRSSLTSWLNLRGFRALEAESLEKAISQI